MVKVYLWKRACVYGCNVFNRKIWKTLQVAPQCSSFLSNCCWCLLAPPLFCSHFLHSSFSLFITDICSLRGKFLSLSYKLFRCVCMHVNGNVSHFLCYGFCFWCSLTYEHNKLNENAFANWSKLKYCKWLVCLFLFVSSRKGPFTLFLCTVDNKFINNNNNNDADDGE